MIVKIFYHVLNIINQIFEGILISYNAKFDAIWEYNLYIGEIGFLVFIFSLWNVIINYKKKFQLTENIYLVPLFIVSILSLSICKGNNRNYRINFKYKYSKS